LAAYVASDAQLHADDGQAHEIGWQSGKTLGWPAKMSGPCGGTGPARSGLCAF